LGRKGIRLPGREPDTYTSLTQDIVETPRETYKGFLALPDLRRKLGELEPPRLKTVNNYVETQGRMKC
jgi:hypothetical protein